MSVEDGSAADGRGGGRVSLSEAVTPMFRAIGVGPQRRGIRLEKIFWDVLDGLAERRGVKRSALIWGLLEDSDDNAASRLRCYALMSVEQERRDILDRTGTQRSIRLMQQAPVPAFAINRQKRLQQANGEFMQYLRVASGSVSTTLSQESVHLSLDTAIDQLFLKLAEPPHAAFCGYSLEIGGKRRQGRVKVVPVPAEPLDVLVGYIIS